MACPVCGKHDWCGVLEDGTVAICMRVASERQARNGGWVHHLLDTVGAVRVQEVVRAERPVNVRDWNRLLRGFARGSDNSFDLALHLQLRESSLQRLGCVWAKPFRAWAFPMRNADREVTGVRLRNLNGRKWAIRGSREGLFIPAGWEPNGTMVLICEGPTDTAAALDLGFQAVGRPSCVGGTALLEKLIRGVPVVVVADRDGPGVEGAERLGASLLRGASSVKLLRPPPWVKDLRDWKALGLSPAALRAIIDNANLFTGRQ